MCMLLDDSPPSSPARKRQRLSSPTYDDQLGDLSQGDLAAFDEIDFQLSQAQPYSPKRKRRSTYNAQSSPIKGQLCSVNVFT